MKRFKQRALSYFSAAAVLMAAGVAQADNYSEWITIDQLLAVGDEFVVYTTGASNNATNNPATCSAGVGQYFFNTGQTSAAGRELMTRTLLAAFLAGKKVQFYVENATNPCYNNYPTYTRVAVDKDL